MGQEIEFIQSDFWYKVKKSNPRAVELANHHYSRIAFGKQGVMVGPPGRLLCFLSQDNLALWVSHWPYAHLAKDGMDSYRCTMFRNESEPLISSVLIKDAMLFTQSLWSEKWPDKPRDEWITWVAPSLIASDNPGYCFKKAGWWTDHNWKSSRKDVKLIRLRSHLV
jgi:hypothetical protein